MESKNNKIIYISLTSIVFIAGIIALYLQYNENVSLKTKISNLEINISSTTDELNRSKNDNANLLEALDTEQRRNEEFQEQVNEIADTVGILDKLSKTDPELLQKYSKVYFLNEHYAPEKLSYINEDFLAPSKEELQIDYRVESFLNKMFNAAKKDDVNLLVISAYRDFFEQQSLKSSYTRTYGSGANTFSADQGYSEHQLGTTVDLTTKELGLNYGDIENTKAYEWLQNNAYKYGFILSYPKGNNYYVFEPWHWRFVGRDLARYLHNEGKNFYDLDQREIDEYLVELFD